MTRINRNDFIQRVQRNSIDLQKVESAESQLWAAGASAWGVAQADLNGDGKISSATEAEALFNYVDSFDTNGSPNSITTTTSQGTPTQSGKVISILDMIMQRGSNQEITSPRETFLANNPDLKTHQDLINFFLSNNGNQWEGAKAEARRNGFDFDFLLGDRNATISASTSAPSRPTTPTTPTTPTAPAGNSALRGVPLNVPYYPQTDNYTMPDRTCNSSACAMAAKYLGANISGDDEYLRTVLRYGDTTDHGAQTKALRHYGIESSFHYNLNYGDIDRSLAAGKPVVLGIQHRGPRHAPRGGHLITVIGKQGNNYIVHDPYGNLNDGYTQSVYRGKNAVYSKQELDARWQVDGPGSGWGRIFH